MSAVKTLIISCGALSMLTYATDASAKYNRDEFSICDGYPSPTTRRSATEQIYLAARSEPYYSADNVDACNAALNSPTLRPNDHLRRATLLVAKALHNLAADNTNEALSDLALSEVEIRTLNTDGDFAASLSIQIKLARAYAERRVGRSDNALASANAAIKELPFSRVTAAAALTSIALSPSDDSATLLRTRLATLDPGTIDFLFTSAFSSSDYSDVISLYPCLIPPPSAAKQSYYSKGDQLSHELEEWRDTQLYWAARTGMYAFALASSGQGDASEIALRLAQSSISTARPVRPDRTELVRDSDRVLVDRLELTISTTRSEATRNLDMWRAQIESGRNPASPPPPIDPWLDQPGREVRDFANLLPPFISDRGFRGSRKSENRHWNIIHFNADAPPGLSPEHLSTSTERASFSCDTRSNQVVCDDLVLFNAARGALRAGAVGFVVRQRRQIYRSIIYYISGVVTNPVPDGSGAEIDVTYIKAGDHPSFAGENGWRIIDAQEVVTNLRKIYPKLE